MERGDHLGKDKPIRGTDVYEIVKQTETASGIEFKPHDLRQTFITACERAQARATGTLATTLRYAQAVDARRARRELKLRYG